MSLDVRPALLSRTIIEHIREQIGEDDDFDFIATVLARVIFRINQSDDGFKNRFESAYSRVEASGGSLEGGGVQ